MVRLIESRTTYHHDIVQRGLALALLAAMSAGCAFDPSGLPGGAEASGASAGGEGGAASSSSGVISSGTSSSCAPGAEICDDGIDNDCNLATDCEDPACKAGFVCIPAIPSGWSAVAFSEQSRSTCPAGYAAAADIVSAPSDASTCVCTCTEQKAASCTVGMVGIATNGAGPCPASPILSLDANGSACGSISINTLKDGLVKIAPLPPTQGTCGGTPKSTKLPLVEGRSCDAAALGAGCADGGACVASPSAPFVACVARDGVEPCPAGFPNGHSVGASAADTRSCSPCACGTSATCSNPKLTFYSDGVCAFGAHELPVSNACDPTNDGNGHAYKSFRYTASMANGACKATSDSMLTGSLVLTGERTVCCQ